MPMTDKKSRELREQDGPIHQDWLRMSPGLSLCKWKAYSLENEERVFPKQSDCFRVMQLLAPEQVRVVILGQDPYHTRGKASGIAFGYHREYTGPIDSSLANIRSEVQRTTGQEEFDISLENWVGQCVLLLNTRLTVFEDVPMSHAGIIGWEPAVQKLLESIHKLRGDNTVWVAWGAEARHFIGEVVGLNSPNVITTSHPCKYSHRATTKPFTGSNCFGRVNEYFRARNQEEIKW